MAMIELEFGRQNFHPLKKKSPLLLKLIAVVFAVLLFCEFLIYYLAIFQCNWPEVKTTASDGEQATREPVLKAMFLADTHLLGEVLGHWLDKLRREWQMERAFQTALWLLQPEVVFILGDIFDEGKWSTPEAWVNDVERFQKMFRHPSHVQLKVVAGNHDIGFHYEMNTYKVERFEKVFSSERLFSWKGINFVMVNSVALNGDGCGICSETEAELIEVSHRLNCSRELLRWFQPRLVLSGHTHSACEVHHGGRVPELSVPSFSWRNRNNPSFIMGSITPTDYTLSKCYLPREDVVLIIYCGMVGFLVVLTLTHFGLLASPFLAGLNLLRKRKTR
ncbi:metallophosphoesterase 1 isoform X5 [Pongo pygmaeus]|uniref:Metallophosphoesterase 1 n=1 Tax=Pongo abelii TaxID=9601 RepID=A0A2J8RFU1_PONAB|nr:metallophosphoesterase 1 isoform X5 [Pongo abelii]XP_009250508.1 metallophosphoesterase 1 isoform X5 [Pongo abelii]XP_054316587.1 metallophosphoesterase 1 isoform X5 [Pongo pygmaeus]XP_054316588.1 metallophosphoesterase 1 isoform X5 [Pongo pygmaeus]XP_054316589.1 metallophosphoesterase 1 isoform X5 [Pongo pygmaeus]XP_054316590.1 metallophosphoesterase 1 isoform X5 [Pongo pygmaeus]XP_054393445.1 metallophosphoesterase 1 isoform X5 [Pongo abelii]XP_054393446.1 metallophosphoesterase 1 isofo